MHISIKQLRAFMALCKHRNFTLAAQSIHLSQPAFSSLITSLELETELRLFSRNTRHVHMTPDGEAFVDIAKHLLEHYDDSIRQIRAQAKGERGRVSVAVLPSIAVCWLPTILKTYQQHCPDIRVELMDVESERCLQAVSDGRADFALTAYSPERTDLKSQVLYSENMFLICHKDHPLARQESVRECDLKGHPFLHFAPNTSIRQCIAKIPVDVAPYAFEVQQLTTMLGLIAAGMGVTLAPQLTLYQFHHRDIAIRPFSGSPISRQIHLVARKKQPLSVAANTFLEHILRFIEPIIDQARIQSRS
jgi:DNA-binding transcriptional LysR family regulator